MNEMIANHQHVVIQKDKQLADYQKQVDNLQKAENELTKQIEEQKAKNNVS
jgi:seryl-tRNA synthetase